MYENGNNIIYFNSFGIKHIQKKLKNSQETKNIRTNIYRIQVYDSIMYGYFCIGFLLKGKGLLDYTNLLSPNNYEKNDNMILKYFL